MKLFSQLRISELGSLFTVICPEAAPLLAEPPISNPAKTKENWPPKVPLFLLPGTSRGFPNALALQTGGRPHHRPGSRNNPSGNNCPAKIKRGGMEESSTSSYALWTLIPVKMAWEWSGWLRRSPDQPCQRSKVEGGGVSEGGDDSSTPLCPGFSLRSRPPHQTTAQAHPHPG